MHIYILLKICYNNISGKEKETTAEGIRKEVRKMSMTAMELKRFEELIRENEQLKRKIEEQDEIIESLYDEISNLKK